MKKQYITPATVVCTCMCESEMLRTSLAVYQYTGYEFNRQLIFYDTYTDTDDESFEIGTKSYSPFDDEV